MAIVPRQRSALWWWSQTCGFSITLKPELAGAGDRLAQVSVRRIPSEQDVRVVDVALVPERVEGDPLGPDPGAQVFERPPGPFRKEVVVGAVQVRVGDPLLPFGCGALASGCLGQPRDREQQQEEKNRRMDIGGPAGGGFPVGPLPSGNGADGAGSTGAAERGKPAAAAGCLETDGHAAPCPRSWECPHREIGLRESHFRMGMAGCQPEPPH